MTAVIPKPAPPKRVRCPRADKQAFPTYELSEAKRIHELGRMVERGWTKHLPTYSYKCPCTFWHWTSREPTRLAELAKLAARRETDAFHRTTQAGRVGQDRRRGTRS